MQKMAYRYHAFLLRVWQEDPGQNEWRASLEAAGSDQRQGFGSLAELLAYLEAVTQQSGPDAANHTQIKRSTQ